MFSSIRFHFSSILSIWWNRFIFIDPFVSLNFHSDFVCSLFAGIWQYWVQVKTELNEVDSVKRSRSRCFCCCCAGAVSAFGTAWRSGSGAGAVHGALSAPTGAGSVGAAGQHPAAGAAPAGLRGHGRPAGGGVGKTGSPARHLPEAGGVQDQRPRGLLPAAVDGRVAAEPSAGALHQQDLCAALPAAHLVQDHQVHQVAARLLLPLRRPPRGKT